MAPQAELDPTDRRLAVEMAALSLARIAPDELVMLEESADEYFADPDALLRRRGPDSPLGAGIPVEMVTPYLLWVGGLVLPLLATFAGEIAKGVGVDLAKEPVSAWVRRLFRRSPAEPTGTVALSAQQARRVREVVVAQCFRAGLPSNEAALIADATLGSLHIRP